MYAVTIDWPLVALAGVFLMTIIMSLHAGFLWYFLAGR